MCWHKLFEQLWGFIIVLFIHIHVTSLSLVWHFSRLLLNVYLTVAWITLSRWSLSVKIYLPPRRQEPETTASPSNKWRLEVRANRDPISWWSADVLHSNEAVSPNSYSQICWDDFWLGGVFFFKGIIDIIPLLLDSPSIWDKIWLPLQLLHLVNVVYCPFLSLFAYFCSNIARPLRCLHRVEHVNLH
jgi:hypothetical protein